MASSKQSRSARNRRSALGRFALVERLETRVAMAAGITLDRSTHTISIIGTAGNDTAQVRQNGSNVVVALTTPSGRFNPTYRANTVSRINFSGLAGNDNFQNLTALPSRADGGSGTDTLRGGRATDERLGGDGNDQLFGDADNDPGFRVRVQNGQFGNLVTGVWQYMTPDKIQIWAKWAYPANDPSQLKDFRAVLVYGSILGQHGGLHESRQLRHLPGKPDLCRLHDIGEWRHADLLRRPPGHNHLVASQPVGELLLQCTQP